ncbi:hypothetical protein VNO77_17261 [Canavalia gladiata]|uniref:Uncharacterized protein n=1 Tax=Canavalia gladiata TaxID=3824 RepID=A0AAN9LIJ5_CANGL
MLSDVVWFEKQKLSTVYSLSAPPTLRPHACGTQLSLPSSSQKCQPLIVVLNGPQLQHLTYSHYSFLPGGIQLTHCF